MWTIKDIIDSPRVKEISQLSYEVSIVIYLLPPDRIVGSRYYDSIGSRDSVLLPVIAQVVQNCKSLGTNRVILVHNHPKNNNGSCDAEPSDSDIESTIEFRRILAQDGISLEDHIIVSPETYFSFRANSLLDDDNKKRKEGLWSQLTSFFFG